MYSYSNKTSKSDGGRRWSESEHKTHTGREMRNRKKEKILKVKEGNG